MIGRFRRPGRNKVLIEVPADIVHRQMLYDGLQDVPAMSELAGLCPISPDVDEMERAASMERLTKIAYLFPCLMDQTQWMSDLALTVQMKELTEAGHEPTEEEVEQVSRAILAVVRASVVSSVSTIVGLGLLDVPEVVQRVQ